MSHFQDDCLIANNQQFKRITQALDSYYGATHLNDKHQSETDLMLSRRKKHIEQIKKKK